ncbi:MAG: DUF502 domain-containing protein [Candidatus Aminicenantales bacterium]
MKGLFKHIGTHVLRGLLAIIPLGLCYLVVRFFYLAVDARITGKIERWIGYKIPGLGFLLVLISLYLLGLVASHWAGRRAFGLIEWISARIPLVKTIYTLGKQLADALSLPEKGAFKRVVMVEHFRPGVWSIGFVTATLRDPDEEGRRLLRMFIPTAPNPTSGFVVTVKESQVKETNWSVPEAMNLIISGGMIGPEKS